MIWYRGTCAPLTINDKAPRSNDRYLCIFYTSNRSATSATIRTSATSHEMQRAFIAPRPRNVCVVEAGNIVQTRGPIITASASLRRGLRRSLPVIAVAVATEMVGEDNGVAHTAAGSAIVSGFGWCLQPGPQSLSSVSPVAGSSAVEWGVLM